MSTVIRRLLLLALLAGAAAPAAAEAAPNAGDPNSVVLQGGVVTAIAEPGKADQIQIEQENANNVTLRTRGAGLGSTWPDANLSPGCSFADDGTGGFWRRIRCTSVNPITKVVVDSGDLNDSVAVLAAPPTLIGVELRGGDGNDVLTGGDKADELSGGTGTDTLRGDDGNDTLRGGDDRDNLLGGTGADDMHGDDGFDSVDYTDRPADQPVSVSLDDAPNDGNAASAEGDNAHRSIEDVFGSQGGDEIKGSEVANELNGGAGNDVIDGGAGTDKFFAGLGNDTVLSRDGGAERIDCGEDPGGSDADVSKTDAVDEVSGCETNEPTTTTQPDRDGDGFLAPPDCNDDDKNIKPGATDIPENGVDENCDDVDAVNLDRDGDGFNRDVDCDDTNPNAKPGGKEVVGNAIDEDCDRVALPIPVIETPVLQFMDFENGRTIVKNLGVGAVPEGTTAAVICKGGKKFGCPLKSKRKVFKKASKRGVNWTRFFRGARLRKGATIIVEITKPGYVGRHVVFKIRPKASPVPRPLCLYPGEKKAKEC